MEDESLDKAMHSLQRVQGFDVNSLPRTAQLGEELNFSEAVEPARRIIRLFQQFPAQFLSELPTHQQGQLVGHADAFYQTLSQITEFNAKQNDAYNVRTNLINSISSQYQSYFNQLYQLISYGSSRERDFTSLEQDFRSTMQRARDEAKVLIEGMAKEQEDAKKILDEVRKVAAEQGVSQQAKYFQDESASHDKESNKWRVWTIATASGLAIYALGSAFSHHIPGLVPTNTYEAFQIGLSKVLIFGVLAYMLILFARNFLAHKHNAIVNRHRQNALLTFNALVDAAGDNEKRDVILTYAAACIFSPQETGYTKSGSGQPEMPLSIIQSLSRVASAGSPH